jgi:hypothetical protein
MRYLTEARADAKAVSLEQFVREYRGAALILRTIKGGTLRKTSSRQLKKLPNSMSGRTLDHQAYASVHRQEGFMDPEVFQDRRFQREALVLLTASPPKPGSRISVGRIARCDVVINDYSVSGLHARFQAAGPYEGAMVRDQASRNGTYVNSNRLEGEGWHPLHTGDCVRMGRVEMVYVSAVDFYPFLRDSLQNPTLDSVMSELGE